MMKKLNQKQNFIHKSRVILIIMMINLNNFLNKIKQMNKIISMNKILLINKNTIV